jgi:hypothetical protein
VKQIPHTFRTTRRPILVRRTRLRLTADFL